MGLEKLLVLALRQDGLERKGCVEFHRRRQCISTAVSWWDLERVAFSSVVLALPLSKA